MGMAALSGLPATEARAENWVDTGYGEVDVDSFKTDADGITDYLVRVPNWDGGFEINAEAADCKKRRWWLVDIRTGETIEGKMAAGEMGPIMLDFVCPRIR